MIIGAGGHGKVVADTAACTKQWEKIVFSDVRYPELSDVGHWSVICDDNDLTENDKHKYDFIVAIGDNHTRYKLHQELIKKGFNLVNVIHPSAEISDYADIGIGNVIMANVVVNIDVKMGDAGIVNTAATIDHDCLIRDGVHISPGAHLAGQVEVGQHSWIGIGATVKQLIVIGADVTLGAGSVAIENIPDGKKAVGIPARF